MHVISDFFISFQRFYFITPMVTENEVSKIISVTKELMLTTLLSGTSEVESGFVT